MVESGAKTLLFVLLTIQPAGTTKGVSFNRRFTGVEFDPYVTDGLGRDSNLDDHTYTVENCKTMLGVISTKFSRILIKGVDASSVPNMSNGSHLYNANLKARSAEVAALINRNRGNLSLTVTLGIDNWDFNAEMNVALDAFQIAQSIFPGTVDGIYIWDVGSMRDINRANDLLQDVRYLRKRTSHLNLRIGIMQKNCEHHLGRSARNKDGLFKVAPWNRQLLTHSDYIICHINSEEDDEELENMGAIAFFNSMSSRMLTLRDHIQSFDNNIEVMWHTTWIAQFGERLRYNVTKHIRDIRDFWISVDNFATQHNFTVWINHAIGASGWWKLRRQASINNRSGYVEYISTLQVDLEIKNSENNTILPVARSQMQGIDKFSTGVSPIIPTATTTYVKIRTKVTTTELSENKTGEENGSQTLWKSITIILGATFLATVLLGLAYGWYKNRFSSRGQNLTRQEMEEFKHGILGNGCQETDNLHFVCSAAFREPYDKLLEIQKQQLEIFTSQLLGGGEFGCVFKAQLKNQWHESTVVALKTTKPNPGAATIRGFLSEIKILTYLGRHPNIVSILGAYTAESHNGTVYIATELCTLGSLRNFLQNIRDQTKAQESFVPFNDMIRWSYEVACGMEYLEQKGVIHADLAARNVLLSSESTAKITDFGLSRRLYDYLSYTKTSQQPLPWRWMAFESLKMKEFSSKSDVWSYGITLWEIFSLGAQPYPGMAWSQDFVETLEEGFRLKQPRYATSEIFDTMENCWNLESDERPSFSKLKRSTRKIMIDAIEDLYIKLDPCGSSKVQCR